MDSQPLPRDLQEERRAFEKSFPQFLFDRIRNAYSFSYVRHAWEGLTKQKEAATLQTLLIDRFADCRPPHPSGLYAWAYSALSLAHTALDRNAILEQAWEAAGAVAALGETDNATVFKCMDAIRALKDPHTADQLRKVAEAMREAAMIAMYPMLRSMISRGEACDLIRSINIDDIIAGAGK